MRDFLKRFDAGSTAFLIFLLALIIRIYGNGNGLPDQINIDEVHLVSRAIKFGSGDLNPHFFFYPALQMYILFASYIFYFLAGSALGLFKSAAEFGMQYFIDPTGFFIIARTLAALMGAGTVWLVIAFGGKYYGRRAGLAAGMFLCFSYLHAVNSHYSNVDVPMTFWAMLSLYLAPGPGARSASKNYILSGMALGASIATKYSSLILIPVLVLSHFLYLFKDKQIRSPLRFINRDLVIMLCAVPLTFLICAPYTVLDFSRFRADCLIQKQLLDFGWFGMETVKNVWWQIPAVYLREGMGLPLLLISLAGIAYAAVRRKGADIFLIFFAVVYYIVHGKSHMVFSRHVIFIMPALCIFAGRLLDDALGLLKFPSNRRTEAVCLIALAVMAAPAREILRTDEILRRPDTRTLAREWIESNIPPGTRIATEMGGPQLHPTPEALMDDRQSSRYAPWRVDAADPFYAYKNRTPVESEATSGKPIHLAALKKLKSKYYVFFPYALAQYKMSLYREKNFNYIIASSSIYDRYFAAADKYPEAAEFYKILDKEAELVKKFPEMPDIRTGPEIKIYYLPPEPATLLKQKAGRGKSSHRGF